MRPLKPRRNHHLPRPINKPPHLPNLHRRQPLREIPCRHKLRPNRKLSRPVNKPHRASLHRIRRRPAAGRPIPRRRRSIPIPLRTQHMTIPIHHRPRQPSPKRPSSREPHRNHNPPTRIYKPHPPPRLPAPPHPWLLKVRQPLRKIPHSTRRNPKPLTPIPPHQRLSLRTQINRRQPLRKPTRLPRNREHLPPPLIKKPVPHPHQPVRKIPHCMNPPR